MRSRAFALSVLLFVLAFFVDWLAALVHCYHEATVQVLQQPEIDVETTLNTAARVTAAKINGQPIMAEDMISKGQTTSSRKSTATQRKTNQASVMAGLTRDGAESSVLHRQLHSLISAFLIVLRP